MDLQQEGNLTKGERQGFAHSPAAKAGALLLLLACVIGLQAAYDRFGNFERPSAQGGAVPASMVRLIDMGFHSTIASFAWASTMPEIIDLLRGRPGYLEDRAYVNTIDPKLSYPYAFSVLTLPILPNVQNGMGAALAIGREGIANGDADWRVPYYMATNYYLWLKDKKDAQWYYDIAARTPGIPEYAQRFAVNFGIGSNEREKTKQLWETIRDTTNDDLTKVRAQAYIDRLDMLDAIEEAARAYKAAYHAYPANIDALVAKGFLAAIPEDPFGFTFVVHSDGTAGIDLNIPPKTITSAQ